MKKEYISPLVHIVWMKAATHLCTPSITGTQGTQNPLEVDGEAQQGSGSDSRRRRRDVWDDDEEDDYAF